MFFLLVVILIKQLTIQHTLHYKHHTAYTSLYIFVHSALLYTLTYSLYNAPDIHRIAATSVETTVDQIPGLRAAGNAGLLLKYIS